MSTDSYLFIKLDGKSTDSPRGSESSPLDTLQNNLQHNNSQLVNSPINEKQPLSIKKELMDGILNSESDPTSSLPFGQKEQLIQQLTLERDKLKEKVRSMAKMDIKEKRKCLSDDTRRKIRQLEEQCEKLRRELTNAKQEEDGLMTEMESTGQAFEEMQEQVIFNIY